MRQSWGCSVIAVTNFLLLKEAASGSEFLLSIRKEDVEGMRKHLFIDHNPTKNDRKK